MDGDIPKMSQMVVLILPPSGWVAGWMDGYGWNGNNLTNQPLKPTFRNVTSRLTTVIQIVPLGIQFRVSNTLKLVSKFFSLELTFVNSVDLCSYFVPSGVFDKRGFKGIVYFVPTMSNLQSTIVRLPLLIQSTQVILDEG